MHSLYLNLTRSERYNSHESVIKIDLVSRCLLHSTYTVGLIHKTTRLICYVIVFHASSCNWWFIWWRPRPSRLAGYHGERTLSLRNACTGFGRRWVQAHIDRLWVWNSNSSFTSFDCYLNTLRKGECLLTSKENLNIRDTRHIKSYPDIILSLSHLP